MKISLFCKKVEAGGGVYFNSLYNKSLSWPTRESRPFEFRQKWQI